MKHQKAVYAKYKVIKNSTGQEVQDCFVLKLDDPHAQQALLAYAESCEGENPDLAHDLRQWVSDTQKG